MRRICLCSFMSFVQREWKQQHKNMAINTILSIGDHDPQTKQSSLFHFILYSSLMGKDQRFGSKPSSVCKAIQSLYPNFKSLIILTSSLANVQLLKSFNRFHFNNRPFSCTYKTQIIITSTNTPHNISMIKTKII